MGVSRCHVWAVTRQTPLRVLSEAEDLVVLVYEATRALPKAELYVLTSQMRRAALSIGSNLAEGSGRSTDADFGRFIGLAEGSASELFFQIGVCRRLEYFTGDQASHLLEAVNRLRRQMRSLRTAVTRS